MSIHRRAPVAALLASLVSAAAVAGAPAPESREASPRQVQCHAEATEQYIAGFHRVGILRDTGDHLTVQFVNDRSRYQTYYEACLARWNSLKPR